MLKYIFFIIFSLLFFGCNSSDGDASKEVITKKYLAITKAPILEPVPITQKIVIEFSAQINESTITQNSAYIQDSSGETLGAYHGISTEANTTKLIFTPYHYLQPFSTYTIFVTTAVQSVDGLSLSKDFNTSFFTALSTVDDTNLRFELFKPSTGVDADVLTDISIQFSKNISDEALYTGTSVIVLKDSNNTVIEGELSFFNSIVTYTPSSPLDLNETYSVDLVGEISDMYGNIYDGDMNWSFKTASTALPVDVGFKSLYKYDFNESISFIRTIKTTSEKNIVAVAVQGGVEFFDLNITFSGYPTLKKKYTYPVSSQINTMEVFDDTMLILGTMNGINIVYPNDVNYTDMNIQTTNAQAVYGVYPGVDFNEVVDKLYAVGPELGMDIFTISTNNTISLDKNIDMSDSIPLKVASASYYSNYASEHVRNIYVTDYNGGMHIYDENGTQLRVVDLNGSTRDIYVFSSYGYPSGLFTTNSIGTSKILDLDGNFSYNEGIDMLSSSAEIGGFYNELTSTTKIYVSDSKKGVVVLNATYDGMLNAESLITTPRSVVSSAVCKDASLELLMVADKEGEVNIFNSISDTSGPTLSTNPTNYSYIASDGNITVTFSEYLTPIDANQVFLIEDVTQTPSKSIPFTLLSSDDAKIFILQPDENLSGVEYNLTVKGTITDRFNNNFNNASDYKMIFYNSAYDSIEY